MSAPRRHPPGAATAVRSGRAGATHCEAKRQDVPAVSSVAFHDPHRLA
ncbi:MAG: hypothetical protein ACREL5_03455 [Gemmatimonadales bacterium]